jgi:2-iminoacetate synthase
MLSGKTTVKNGEDPMFTTVHSEIWAAASRGQPVDQTDAPVASIGAYSSSAIDLLWDPRLGQVDEFDRAILERSAAIKQRLFHHQIFGVVPIYVTSVCAEHCLYCNYRAGNKRSEIERVRLSDDELMREVKFLVHEKGLRALELVYATDPHLRADVMCRQVGLVREYLERHGGGMVGINAEALDEAEYRALRDAGLAFAVLWQETYDKSRYRELHPGNSKKTHFEYRVEAYERMLAAGIRNIGMGVLSGLSDWRSDWTALMQHEAYLRRSYGIEVAILGVPRLKPASGAILQSSRFVPTRREFLAILAIHNLFSPSTLAFVNTREDWDLCLEMARGGGCMYTFNCSTIPGGYSLGHRGYQFPTATFDVTVFAEKAERAGLKPVFNWAFNSKAEHRPKRVFASSPEPAVHA